MKFPKNHKKWQKTRFLAKNVKFENAFFFSFLKKATGFDGKLSFVKKIKRPCSEKCRNPVLGHFFWASEKKHEKSRFFQKILKKLRGISLGVPFYFFRKFILTKEKKQVILTGVFIFASVVLPKTQKRSKVKKTWKRFSLRPAFIFWTTFCHFGVPEICQKRRSRFLAIFEPNFGSFFGPILMPFHK